MQTNKQQNAEMKTDFSRSRSSIPRSLKGGFTLFYSVLVSSLLLAIGLAILNITLKEFTLSSGARDSETAFYAADSALECALYWDNTQRIFGYYGDSLAGGLAAYWRFEESTAQQNDDPPIIIDSSGSGRHGRAAGAPVWTDATGGKIDQALIFDGVDDYVALDSTVSLESDFTISAWLTVPILTTDNDYFLSGSGNTRFGFFMLTDPKGGPPVTQHHFQILIAGPKTTVDPTLQDGSFHHFVWRRQGSSVELIVDGTLVATYANQPNTVNINALGYYSVSGSGFYKGMLDDVRVYSRALTDTEITALNTFDIRAGFVGPIDRDSAAEGEITCSGNNINSPEDGWWTKDGTLLGWEVENLSPGNDGLESYKTTFDVLFSNNTCGLVEVYKDDTAATTIISRGYNTCDLDSPRRLERAIRAQY